MIPKRLIPPSSCEHQSLNSYLLLLLLLCLTFSDCQFDEKNYRLYKSVTIPSSLLQSDDAHSFGGDLRIGDLQNEGTLDLLIYRAANSVDGGATQPCFLAAFDLDEHILWQVGKGGLQPNRPGPVAIHDIDADGQSEVICLLAYQDNMDPFSMQGIELQIRDGKTGVLENFVQPEILTQAAGEGANWVHQRILIANLRGNPTPQDFIIKLGTTIFAFDDQLHCLWTYYNQNDQYQQCPAYIPAVGDVDGDGKDEVNGGYYLLSSSGDVRWEKKLGKNMDSVAFDYWDHPQKKRAFYSGHGFVMDEHGDTILHLGPNLVPHGQELRVANFSNKSTGIEMMIRYNGHTPSVRLVSQSGATLRSFTLNESPNNTGMEAIYWSSPREPALLYNGGALWSAEGKLITTFEHLPQPPQGNKRQGWYHCISVDVTGDDGEDVVIYNPWDDTIYIYTKAQPNWDQNKAYVAGPKQYNARLMD